MREGRAPGAAFGGLGRGRALSFAWIWIGHGTGDGRTGRCRKLDSSVCDVGNLVGQFTTSLRHFKRLRPVAGIGRSFRLVVSQLAEHQAQEVFPRA